MSDSAKTEQRPAIWAPSFASSASPPNSSTGISSLAAWWSRNEPVPAAQTVFMAKSVTTPSRSRMSLESCPPISITVRTPGHDVRGRDRVGGYLVLHEVGADDHAGEVAGAAGCAGSQHLDAGGKLVPDLPDALLDGGDRLAPGAKVNRRENLSRAVERYDVRRDGADVDAQERTGWRRPLSALSRSSGQEVLFCGFSNFE